MPPPQNALAYQHPPTSLRPVPLQSAAVEPWLASKWPPKTTNPAHAAPAARVPSSTPTTLPTAKRCQVPGVCPTCGTAPPQSSPCRSSNQTTGPAHCSLQQAVAAASATPNSCAAVLRLTAPQSCMGRGCSTKAASATSDCCASTLHPTAPLRLTAAHHCTSKLRGPLPSR